MWPHFTPVGTRWFGFALFHFSGAYTWQAYVSSGVGSWPMSGVHQVVVPPSVSITDSEVPYFVSWYVPVTQSTLNLWWESNLGILVWQFGMQLIISVTCLIE